MITSTIDISIGALQIHPMALKALNSDNCTYLLYLNIYKI